MRLHVHEWGDAAAPPLVCLHGVSGHGRRFRKLVEERLAGRFHVLAPDLRGHGRSAWDPPWSLERHLDDVLETLELLGVRPASWLGHSFGGRVILEVGDVAPELVERAVLLDPAIRIQPERALELAESERADKAFSSVDEAIEKRIETAPLYRTPRELLEEEMREHLTESPDGRLRYRYCQSAVVTMYGELAGADAFDLARVPTLLVVGADSGLVTESQVTKLRNALAEQLTVVTVPGGHIVLWDAFGETADAIDAFL